MDIFIYRLYTFREALSIQYKAGILAFIISIIPSHFEHKTVDFILNRNSCDDYSCATAHDLNVIPYSPLFA